MLVLLSAVPKPGPPVPQPEDSLAARIVGSGEVSTWRIGREVFLAEKRRGSVRRLDLSFPQPDTSPHFLFRTRATTLVAWIARPVAMPADRSLPKVYLFRQSQARAVDEALRHSTPVADDVETIELRPGIPDEASIPELSAPA